MIAGLRGEVIAKHPSYLHIDVHGVIYEVHISINCAARVEKNAPCFIHTVEVIREDARLLFGFVSMDEKRMFETLIKINGVGPKVALAVCSTFEPVDFTQIAQASDVTSLKQVPGIGPKSAKRILVELADFDLTGDEQSPQNKAAIEAGAALENLGFKKEQIAKVFKECQSSDTSALVKEALKKMQK